MLKIVKYHFWGGISSFTQDLFSLIIGAVWRGCECWVWGRGLVQPASSQHPPCSLMGWKRVWFILILVWNKEVGWLFNILVKKLKELKNIPILLNMCWKFFLSNGFMSLRMRCLTSGPALCLPHWSVPHWVSCCSHARSLLSVIKCVLRKGPGSYLCYKLKL